MAHRTRAILPTRRRSGGLSFWKAKLSGESAENRADGAGVEAFELEEKGDELVRALGYALQHDALEDRHVVTEAGLMGGEVFGGEEVDAGSVDPDQLHALSRQVVDELG